MAIHKLRRFSSKQFIEKFIEILHIRRRRRVRVCAFIWGGALSMTRRVFFFFSLSNRRRRRLKKTRLLNDKKNDKKNDDADDDGASSQSTTDNKVFLVPFLKFFFFKVSLSFLFSFEF